MQYLDENLHRKTGVVISANTTANIYRAANTGNTAIITHNWTKNRDARTSRRVDEHEKNKPSYVDHKCIHNHWKHVNDNEDHQEKYHGKKHHQDNSNKNTPQVLHEVKKHVVPYARSAPISINAEHLSPLTEMFVFVNDIMVNDYVVAAVNPIGSINYATISRQGTGYVQSNTTIAILGANTKPAIATANVANGQITDIEFSDYGAGYSQNAQIQIISAIGTGAKANVSITFTKGNSLFTDKNGSLTCNLMMPNSVDLKIPAGEVLISVSSNPLQPKKGTSYAEAIYTVTKSVGCVSKGGKPKSKDRTSNPACPDVSSVGNKNSPKNHTSVFHSPSNWYQTVPSGYKIGDTNPTFSVSALPGDSANFSVNVDASGKISLTGSITQSNKLGSYTFSIKPPPGIIFTPDSIATQLGQWDEATLQKFPNIPSSGMTSTIAADGTITCTLAIENSSGTTQTASGTTSVQGYVDKGSSAFYQVNEYTGSLSSPTLVTANVDGSLLTGVKLTAFKQAINGSSTTNYDPNINASTSPPQPLFFMASYPQTSATLKNLASVASSSYGAGAENAVADIVNKAIAGAQGGLTTAKSLTDAVVNSAGVDVATQTSAVYWLGQMKNASSQSEVDSLMQTANQFISNGVSGGSFTATQAASLLSIAYQAGTTTAIALNKG